MRVSIRADEREGVHDATCGRAARLHVQTCAPNGPISSGGGGEADQNDGLENTHTKGHAAGGCGHFATSTLLFELFRFTMLQTW